MTLLVDVTFSPISLVEVVEEYVNASLRVLPTLLMALTVLAIFVILARTTRDSVEKLARTALDDSSLANLAGTTVSTVLVVVGLFAAATILFPGLRAGDIVAVLGLSSVAVGFAFKDIFENFLAGVLLLWQRPFVVGDQIEVQDFAGVIEHIDIRSTSLRSYGGELVVIPNSDVYSCAVIVNTDTDARRSTFETGIGYNEDIEEGRQVIVDAVNDCDLVFDDPGPRAVVSGHGDSSVDFKVQYWTKSDRKTETLARDQVATRIKYALDEAEIEIPYPYRTVEFFDKSEG